MATIVVKNTTNQSRTGIVTVGIPFDKSYNLQPSDKLVANNAVTGVNNLKLQWSPQGVRWDTQAVKYARATFKVDLAPNEEKQVVVSRSIASTDVTYAPPQNLLTQIQSTVIQLTIQGNTITVPMSTLLNSASIIETTGTHDHYRRYRYFTYFPDVPSSPQLKYMWMDIVIDVQSGLSQVPFFFRFGYYRFYPQMENAAGVNPYIDFSQPVVLRIIGARSKIRWEQYKVPSIVDVSGTNREYTLMTTDSWPNNSNRIAAGGSHCYKGVLCYTNTSTDTAELTDPILAIAEDWKTFYPITGFMPDQPPYVTSEANALARSETLRGIVESSVVSRRDPYNWPSICNNPTVTDAGAHGIRDYAYGIRGWPILSTANYNWIPFLEFSTRQQATRHNWYVDANGQPIAPSTFQNSGVRFWNGSFHGVPGNYYRGFNAPVFYNDCPKAPNSNTAVYGPDKEHYTNKMFILQGFLTMDWFSLEYAKMYSKYWIYANRIDAYPTFLVSDIHHWGAPRAAGRTYEVAAFLYEFYADQELKDLITQRSAFVLSAFTRERLRDKNAFPGGPNSRIRATELGPCGQAACLNSLTHWRPWEEGQFCLGAYFMARCLLNENPSSTEGNRLLSFARDTAASVLLMGYMDGRSTSSPSRRFMTVRCNTLSEKNAFMLAVGAIPGVVNLVGTSSGATGKVWYVNTDYNINLPATHIKINLTDVIGDFNVGEVVQLQTGPTAIVVRGYPFDGGFKSYAINSPTLGFGYKLSESELEILSQPNEDPNYPSYDFTWNTPAYPMGIPKYGYTTTLYVLNQSQAAVIAREAAKENYYSSDNALVIAKANDLISYLYDNYQSDNGDFDEGYLCFVGYLVSDLLDSGNASAFPSPLEVTSSMVSPSISISQNVINIQRQAAAHIFGITPGHAGTSTTTSTDIIFSAKPLTLGLSGPNERVVAECIKTATSQPVNIVTSMVSATYTETNFNYRIKNVVHFIGSAPIVVSPNSGNEVPSAEPNGGGAGPYVLHYTNLLNVINDINGYIDYYTLLNPINQSPGSIGELVPINGQVLSSQGYIWDLDPASTAYNLVSFTVDGEISHQISKAERGGFIDSWSVSIGDASMELLSNSDVTERIEMSERYDTNINLSTRKVYYPNFAGAQSSSETDVVKFVSPYRSINSYKTYGNGRILEGSVTPLELDSSPHGGSADVPAIASDMCMYYNYAVNVYDAYTTQLDFWSQHLRGIPLGPHDLNLNFIINAPLGFTEIAIYSIDLGIQVPFSYLLGLNNSKVKFSKSKTELTTYTSDGQPTVTSLPALIAGKSALILTNSSINMYCALVGEISDETEELKLPTSFYFENVYNTVQAKYLTKIGIVSDSRFTVIGKDTHRYPGWIGTRMYLIFDTNYQSLIDKILALNEQDLIKANINELGAYQYTRPAII